MICIKGAASMKMIVLATTDRQIDNGRTNARWAPQTLTRKKSRNIRAVSEANHRVCRNFEGRQGYKGRTHLTSSAMVTAATIAGLFDDTSEWK